MLREGPTMVLFVYKWSLLYIYTYVCIFSPKGDWGKNILKERESERKREKCEKKAVLFMGP